MLPSLAFVALLQSAAPPAETPPLPPPSVPPPAARPFGPLVSPLAAPRAAAEAMLALERASDVFADETAASASGPDAIRLRHRPSGFLCRLDPAARLRVQVYASLTRGDDVRCSQLTPGGGLRVVFFYRTAGTPLERLAFAADREIRNEVHDDARSPGLADRRTVAAAGAVPEHVVETLEGAQLADRFVLGKVGDWAVQLRVLGPHAASAPSAALEAEWRALLADRGASAPLAATPPKAQTVTPEAARAEAGRLLARSGAAAWFEVADGATPTLRHKESGALCAFEPGVAENEVAVLNHPPPGSDLKCVTRGVDAIVSTFLTHLQPAPTLKDAFAGFVTEIRAVHPDAKPYVGTSMRVERSGGPESLTARFTYTREGREVFSRLQVALLHGWIVEQRLDGPTEHAAAFDLLGGMSFLRTVGALPASPSPPPGGEGGARRGAVGG